MNADFSDMLPPFQDVLTFMHMGAGSRKAMGDVILLDGRQFVISGAVLSHVYAAPCEGSGLMAPVPRTRVRKTGEAWSREAVLRRLIKLFGENPQDRHLLFNLAGKAVSVDTPRCLLAAAWTITSLQAEDSRLLLDYMPLARYINRSPWRDEIMDRLPPLLRWAMERKGSVAPRFMANEELWSPSEQDSKTAFGMLEQAMPDLIAGFQQEQLPISAFTPATMRFSGEKAVVVGPLDEDCSAYSVLSRFYDDAWVALPDELGSLEDPFEAGSPEYLEAACEAVSYPDCAYSMRDVSIDFPTWNVALAAALGLRYRRLSADGSPSDAKRTFKCVLDRFKQCSREDRAKLTVIFPELINQARRGHASYKQFDERIQVLVNELLREATDPIYCAIDEMFYADAEEDLDTEAVDVPVSPHVVVEALPELDSPGKRGQRVLRSKVMVNDLLALEWALPDGENSFSQATESTLAWLSERIGTTLPSTWSSGIHEIELGGIRVQVAANDALFALRLEHPDSDQVARTWRLEAVLVNGIDGGGGAGLRLSTQDRTDLARPFRSIPGLIKAWREMPGLCVAKGVVERMDVSSSIMLFRLRNEIRDPQRKHAIWVCASQEAEVMNRQPALSQVWSVGSELIAEYDGMLQPMVPGSWHSYEPGQVLPMTHSLADARKHVDQLITSACRANKAGPGFRDALDFIREASSKALLAARSSQRGEVSAPPDPPNFTAAASDLQDQLDAAIGEADALRGELSTAHATISQLKGRLHNLLTLTEESSEPTGEPSCEFPSKLDGLAAWSATIAPRVRFADKAIRVASRIDHREPGLIYSALQALHDHYWPMRWGDDPDAKERWESFLMESRLRCGPVGAAVGNHQFSDAYQAVIAGKRMELSMHVQGNSTRDPRRCLRIYFACDEERRLIGVGSLPGHLDSTLT